LKKKDVKGRGNLYSPKPYIKKKSLSKDEKDNLTQIFKGIGRARLGMTGEE